MHLSPFIIAVFCELDEWFMGQHKLPERGPKPTLSDSEVLTMQIVGQFSWGSTPRRREGPLGLLQAPLPRVLLPTLREKCTAAPSPQKWPICGSPRSGCGEAAVATSAAPSDRLGS